MAIVRVPYDFDDRKAFARRVLDAGAIGKKKKKKKKSEIVKK